MVKNYKCRNTSAAGEKSIGTKERAEAHIVKEVSRMRTFTKEQSQALLNQAEEMMKHMGGRPECKGRDGQDLCGKSG